MSKDSSRPQPPRWDTVYLVCRACSKRGNGPKDVKPKKIVSELRSHAKEARPRPRVVLTTCLGLCPKRATAVARFGRGDAAIAAIESTDQLGALVTKG